MPGSLLRACLAAALIPGLVAVPALAQVPGTPTVSTTPGHGTVWGMGIIILVIFLFSAISVFSIVRLTRHVRETFWVRAADPTTGDPAWRTFLLQLPLGAPEGSIRALLSMFVIVFGMLALILQDQLGLKNAEVIAGFVGIVITFYFTARSQDQAQKAATAAIDLSKQQVEQANQTAAAATDALKAAAAVPAAPAAPAGPDPAVTEAQSSLRGVREGLETASQLIKTLDGFNVGSGVLGNVGALTQGAANMLETIDPLLSGSPDPAKIGDVLKKATGVLGQLDNAGLPGAIGDAVAGLSGLAGTASALAPILTGLSGGPAGLVVGIITSGVTLMQQREKFNAWKAALLRTPFDKALMPAAVDGTLALAALQPDVAPLMAARVGTGDPALATELMRALLRQDGSGAPVSSAALAAELIDPANALGLATKFHSADELREAIDQYRGALVFNAARDLLAGSVAVPAVDGQPARELDLQALATTCLQLSADPRAAGDIERLVFLVEALGEQFGADKLQQMLPTLLAKGLQLASLGRQQKDERQ